MNTHIDTLAAWWHNAEGGIAHPGDTVIVRNDADGAYEVYTSESGEAAQYAHLRILHRAPAPKPAWHDAVAVIAHKEGDYGPTLREVYTPGVPGEWESINYYAAPADLIDVTPLIEQKVTDEMVDRALAEAESCGYIERVFGDVEQEDRDAIRSVVTAALGLDPA